MPDTKITALAAITVVDPAVDVFPIVDVSDTSMAASGTTKKITSNQLLGAGGTATLASATITGALGAAGLNVTGATIPANGVYLPSANNLGFAYNSTLGMTLNSTGLGVGVSPATSSKIHTLGNGNNVYAVFQNGDTLAASKTSQIWLSNGPSFLGANNREYRIVNSGTSATASDLVFDYWNGTAISERMRIDSAGNVGVGVTPSAWGGGGRAFEIGFIGTGIQSRNNQYSAFTQNSWFNSSAQWIYGATGLASRYDQDAGTHKWFIAPSGTAGNAITFTQAMTLDASGNLLVGLTSNPNTARAYFRYDTLTTQPVINSASVVAASTSWSHFIGQSGNGSSITTSNIFIYGNGNIQNVNGVYGTISDLRLKENISDARNYLADLLKLRVVKYSLKEEASSVANKLGFIAQEVEQVFPAMVDTDPNDGNKGIKTSVLIPMLVKSIQELTARVQTLEAR